MSEVGKAIKNWLNELVVETSNAQRGENFPALSVEGTKTCVREIPVVVFWNVARGGWEFILNVGIFGILWNLTSRN